MQAGSCLESLHAPLRAHSYGKQSAASHRPRPQWWLEPVGGKGLILKEALCTSLDNCNQTLCMENFYKSGDIWVGAM